MDEILDIVNDQDEIIGQATSEDVHAKGLLHRYVHVFVFQDDGRLVVQRRHASMKNYPLTFDASVGEHVSHGETYEEAAKRGLMEELGIEAEISFCCTMENRADPSVENMLGQLFIAHHNGRYKPQPEEVSGLEFMTLDEAKHMMERYPYLICGNFQASLFAYFKVFGTSGRLSKLLSFFQKS